MKARSARLIGAALIARDIQHMFLAARFCECDLLLSFAIAVFVGFARLGGALMAGDTLFVFGALHVGWQNRAAARVAEQMRPLCKTVTDRHPSVENKTVALPTALL